MILSSFLKLKYSRAHIFPLMVIASLLISCGGGGSGAGNSATTSSRATTIARPAGPLLLLQHLWQKAPN